MSANLRVSGELADGTPPPRTRTSGDFRRIFSHVMSVKQVQLPQMSRPDHLIEPSSGVSYHHLITVFECMNARCTDCAPTIINISLSIIAVTFEHTISKYEGFRVAEIQLRGMWSRSCVFLHVFTPKLCWVTKTSVV